MEEKVMELEKDMTPILLEDLGMRYPTENSNYKARFGLYQCQYCGKEFECATRSVKGGSTKSCGCLTTATHGLRSHRLYKTWAGMYHRCYSEKNPKYNIYGGRGIKVCERWHIISNFIEDMYPSYLEGLTLDRIDVDGDYELDNCRWVDKYIQSQNTRDLSVRNKSGFRGVYWDKRGSKWVVEIRVNKKKIYLGSYTSALEAAKAYETYVRLNNLEHNFTPALTPEEIEELNKQKEKK